MISFTQWNDLHWFYLSEATETTNTISANTKGVMHELLTGYHLNGGNHMEKHHDVNGHSPKEAHDQLKSTLSHENYKKINDRAKAAADDIKKRIGHPIKHVHWTSKPGDIHRSTGIHSTQKQDASDIMVSDKHGKHHGISLKVTDGNSGHVPVSNPGMESTHGGEKILAAHRENIKNQHPELKKLTNAASRKEWAKANPEAHAEIKRQNAHVLHSIAEHMHKHLTSGTHEDLVAHIRTHVLHAHATPLQQAGHNHIRHTTYGNHSTNAINPAAHHEHILADPKHINLKTERSGAAISFYYKGKKFAQHRMKYNSQSDPLSVVKGSGTMHGK